MRLTEENRKGVNHGLHFSQVILLLIALLHCGLIALAQKPALHSEPVNNPVLQQYNIRHVNSDADGKVWLSTSNGLLSFDGNDVPVFKHKDGI